LAEVPCPTFTDPELDSVNVGAVTVSEIVVLTVRLPDVPVMVRTDGPAVAVLLAVRVNTLAPEVGLALHEAVTPLGRPDMDRFALPEKPYSGVSVRVDVAAPP
jgi:hypothetical protein